MPKPRQRQRIVYCDCFDCLDRPAPTISNPLELAASIAVARQDPPPKALLLYGSGFLRQSDDGAVNLDASSFPHLDRVAREGNLGLLAVQPLAPASAAGSASAAVLELAAVLGVSEAFKGNGTWSTALPCLASRFKSMSSLFASTSSEATALAQALGMAVDTSLQRPVTQANEDPGADPAPVPADGAGTENSEHPTLLLPSADGAAQRIIADLGVEDGRSGHDLMMLHLDVRDLAATIAAAAATSASAAAAVEGSSAAAGPASAISEEQLLDASLEGLEWMDGLMKSLMKNPGVAERTLLVLILSCQGHALGPVNAGASSGTPDQQQQKQAAVAAAAGAMRVQVQDLMQPGGAAIDPGACVVTPGSAMLSSIASSGTAAAFSGIDKSPCPVVQRPMQSFQKQGLVQVSVQLDAPMLVAQRLPGVTRRDRCERLGLQECHTRGGQGCILASRLLPEIAYKLGRASKYGA